MRYIVFFVFILSALVGCTSTKDQTVSQKDMIKFILTAIGTPEKINKQTESYIFAMQIKDPDNSSYYGCIGKIFSSEIVLEKYIPEYQALVPPEAVAAQYNLLKSDSGKKFAKLVKSGPPFDNVRSQLTQQETIDFEKFGKEFSKYYNEESNAKLREISSRLGMELAEEAKKECSSLYKSFYTF